MILTVMFLGIQLALVGTLYGFAAIISLLRNAPNWFEVHPLAVIIIANTLCLLLIVHIEGRWKGPVWPYLLRDQPIQLLWVLPTLMTSCGLAIVILNLLMAAYNLLGELEFLRAWLEQTETFSLRHHPLGVLLTTLVVAPITEEILFRRMILGGLLQRIRPRSAIALSAGLFAIVHVNLVQLPVTLALGFLLGWIYHRTRSLMLCIGMHFLQNFCAILYFSYGSPEYTPAWLQPLHDSSAMLFNPVGALLALTSFGLGLLWLGKTLPSAPAWAPPPEPVTPPPLPPPLPTSGGLRPCASPPAAVHSSVPTIMSADLATLVTTIAQRARAASHVLATVPTAQKNAALHRLAELIPAAAEKLTAANQQDLAAAEENGLTPAQIDRLTLTPARLEQLAESVRQVADLPDPVGQALETTTRPNGLVIEKRRVPIGVIGIIYEARPNVTIDCAILCLKSGNAAILRGGKEIFHTNTALAALIAEALEAAELPADAVQLIPTTDRAALNTLLTLDELIHCIIPRGGEGLIRFVAQNSTIPVIKHYTGVCYVYLDRAADPDLAVSITVNAKTQRPGVCNAAEQLLVDSGAAEALLPRIGRALHQAGVELRVDATAADILNAANVPHVAGTPEDFTAEFLNLTMAVQVIDNLEAAIAVINRDSSGHSETIVTSNAEAAARFQAAIDSSAVFWNASTRFNDGFEFGFGAEIGISTDRLHARGPMGLPELCSYKYVITGTGQTRG